MDLHEVRSRPAPWSEARRSVKHKLALPFAALEWSLEWLAGGRLDALQELNEDHVPLVGVDASGAFLQGLHMEKANLARANLNAADVRNAVLPAVDFSDANLRSANFRDSNCRGASFRGATLDDADFSGADLGNADFSGATLASADLRNADLRGIDWAHISSIKGANIAGIKNAPEGFVAWALKNGAVQAAAGNP